MGGCEAPVAMPSTAPASAPAPWSCFSVTRNTPANSKGDHFPAASSLCQHCHHFEGWHSGVQTLAWAKSSLQRRGCFERGVHGADPPSGVATASHRQGRAAAPPRATQAPRGCAGATLSPGPLRNVPQPTWGCRWLCTLPPATLPTTGPPLSPKEKALAVACRGRASCPTRTLPPWQPLPLPAAAVQVPRAWTGKGRGCQGRTQQRFLWPMVGEGSQENYSIPSSLKSPARQHRDRCWFWGSRK